MIIVTKETPTKNIKLQNDQSKQMTQVQVVKHLSKEPPPKEEVVIQRKQQLQWQ
jgi:hypothetical protein